MKEKTKENGRKLTDRKRNFSNLNINSAFKNNKLRATKKYREDCGIVMLITIAVLLLIAFIIFALIILVRLEKRVTEYSVFDRKARMKDKMPNKLILENSPYLLQHAYNPVNWFAWNDEPFEKAKNEGKLIFLSIGYSTCHWCHVMEKESFEDEEVAKILNENYISIKVDREERPDIDAIYMTVCQAISGSGGWPLTVILTPDKKPIFAGTYFPKKSMFGKPGLIEILNEINNLWNKHKEKLEQNANEITTLIKNYVESPRIKDEIDNEIIEDTYKKLEKMYDREYGGFGSAPKFPIPHTLLFLLSYWYRTKKETALEMVKKTLTAMRLGGIYDQIGFGFHRYSTDEKWHIPHFEKMIYDQAMISIAYSQTYAITKNEFYKKVAEEILTYVARDMTSPDGAFYTAEDADSEGQEGKFYMWKVEEIKNALGENDAKLFLEIFNLTAIDNLNPHNLFENNERYVLYLKHPVPIDLTEKVNSLREKLFDIRAKRIRPFKDDKILTDWNGLMIASLSIASRVFNRPDYAIKAKNAADFILEKMDNKNGGLFHSYRENMSKVNGFLNDYAFFCWGLLELYEATFDIKYLKKAISFTDYQLEHFRDERNGAMFITTKENTEHIMKTPEVYDGAIPSGNSVSLHNLLRLYHLTGNNKYNQYAHELINAFSSEIKKYGPGYTHFLSGVDFALNSSYQIVIVGKRNTENMKLLLSALNSQFLPNKVVLLKDDDITDTIEQIAPYTKYHKPIANKATAYVCKNFVCHLPTTDAKEMLTLFKN